MTVDEMIDAGRHWVSSEELLFGPADEDGMRDTFEGEVVPPEFWHHFWNITGQKGEGSFFSCHC